MSDFDWMSQPGAEKPAADVDKMAALEAKIAAMAGQLEQAQRTSQAIAAQPNVAVRPNLSTEVDMTNLPDPVTEPEKYAREVAQRTRTVIDNEQKLRQWEQGQQQTAQDQMTQLRSGFRGKYANIKVKDAILDSYGELAVKAAVAKNLDPGRYVFGMRDQFYDDVVALMREDGINPTAETQPAPDTTPDLRTQGIPGGSAAPGSPVGNPDPGKQEAAANDMFGPVRAFQQKHGFYA